MPTASEPDGRRHGFPLSRADGLKGPRIIVPFVKGMLHRFTTRSVTAFAPGAEYREVDERDGYWRLLSELWEGGEHFVIIEQDIEILKDTIPSFVACPESWCMAPYGGPHRIDAGHEGQLAKIVTGLGCTRFSSEVIAAVPDLLERVAQVQDNNMGPKYWRLLDSRLYAMLHAALGNATPHEHDEVLHHHGPLTKVNPYIAGCACGTDCE